jgi:DNA polymerase elongation subunit (family B)
MSEEFFYTSIDSEGNDILFRGYIGGKRVNQKLSYQPSLYLKSNSPSQYKSLDDIPLEKKVFESIRDARNFTSTYKDVEGFKIYGNQRYQYAFITDTWKEIEYDTSKIISAYIDIEVDSSNGFPFPEQADKEITAITVLINNKYYVFSAGEFNNTFEDVQFVKCSSEVELIKKFLSLWCKAQPDILTGWNVDMFDVPYLVNRITNLLGYPESCRMSPWKKLKPRTIKLGKREIQTYDIVGVAVLDYIELYKKFAPNLGPEDYKLETIASLELGEHKLDYHSEYKNLHELRAKNHQLYIEYNIQDVRLVRWLDDKLKLIELVITLAYMNKCNYEDAFSQGRMWDAIIYNKFLSKNIIVPPEVDSHNWRPYEGAYVKIPQPGWYRYIVSFDLTSLYPHLIMMYNMSPETLLLAMDYDLETQEFMANLWNSKDIMKNILDKKLDLTILKRKDLTLTPNKQLFRTDKRGLLGEIMEDMFLERTKYKKLELDAKKKAELTHDEDEKKVHKSTAARYKAIQSAIKVTLNSAYGSLGNKYFRLFDIRIAEAITLAGQLAILWVTKDINNWFNSLLKTKNVDYIIYADTDSMYINMEEIIKRMSTPEASVKDNIALMDKICEQKIKPFIDKSYSDLKDYLNAYAQKMIMKREALADQGIWMAKKNYILSVYDNEGVVYEKPDIKITGWAAVRSDKPKVCRDKLKETISIILETKDVTKLRKFVAQFKSEFKLLELEKIASPTGVSDMEAYSCPPTIYAKGSPMHVKACLIYNHFIDDYGLGNKYEKIQNKDKIKFVLLKQPNPFHQSVMGFLNDPPEEFELNKYIDKEAQFHKVYAQPLSMVLDAINWKLEEEATLEDFFS